MPYNSDVIKGMSDQAWAQSESVNRAGAAPLRKNNSMVTFDEALKCLPCP